jgi:sugar phosphate isomerase/epimerase
MTYKTTLLTVCALVVGLACLAAPAVAQDAAKGCPTAESIGWQLGCQAYSFNRFTFYEAVDKTASLGLKWIEAYPGQRLSKDKPESVKLEHSMPAELQKEVLEKLKSAGVTLFSYGVVGLSKDEAEARKVFDFAKAMGIKVIVSEPAPAALPMLDSLCKEYDVKVAIHNHPKPSMYWDYKKLLAATKDVSDRIGSCSDTGHWSRSGIKPVEAITALCDAKRVVSLHFKDLNEFGNPDAHDVAWGTGVSQAKEVLAELHKTGFKGMFAIEYEYNWDNSVPDIAVCVANFEKMAQELVAAGTK